MGIFPEDNTGDDEEVTQETIVIATQAAIELINMNTDRTKDREQYHLIKNLSPQERIFVVACLMGHIRNLTDRLDEA